MICFWCEEPVEEWDRHPDFPLPTHFACGFRALAGSVAHVTRRCGCFCPGSSESDPPGMTLREAALAALEAWQLMAAAAKSPASTTVN